MDASDLYIELLKKCLTGGISNPRNGPKIITEQECAVLLSDAEEKFKLHLQRAGYENLKAFHDDRAYPSYGSAQQLCDWLNYLHRDRTPDTMSEMSTLDNLQWCVEEVLRNEVPGDFIETGIWKGGLPIFICGLLKARNVTDRLVWGADSFEGLPEPDPTENLEDAIPWFLFAPLERLKISRDFVENTFRKYGLLDEKVQFLEGWFSDTLPSAPIDKLALMRLDGDWYESTMTALNALYGKLSQGGFVIIDDYGLFKGCRDAVDQFRQKHNIAAPLVRVNHQVAFWKKD